VIEKGPERYLSSEWLQDIPEVGDVNLQLGSEE
jgi:hypothetical protein